MRVLLLSVALVFGLLDHALHGWGRSAFAAGIAVAAPTIGYRKFWSQGRFWITAAHLSSVQVPLVMAVRPLIDDLQFGGMLAFGIADCVFMTLALAWVCSQSRGSTGQ
jgi:hypothetical protein